jgi:hypothetical protein
MFRNSRLPPAMEAGGYARCHLWVGEAVYSVLCCLYRGMDRMMSGVVVVHSTRRYVLYYNKCRPRHAAYLQPCLKMYGSVPCSN